MSTRNVRIAAALIAMVSLLGVSSTVAVADEADFGTLVLSPTSGPTGTTVSVSGQQPCPAAPTGETLDSVAVQLFDFRDTVTPHNAEAKPDSTGKWTASLSISNLRNGGYEVAAACVAKMANGEFEDYYDYTGSFVVTSPAGSADPVVRLAGRDRIDTAVAISQDEFLDPAFGAVLVRSDSFADALAGSALAQLLSVPLLLTGRSELDPRVEQELHRVVTEGGEVTVLGGSEAVSATVVDRLVSLGYSVTRIAGTNRFATAAAIADQQVQDASTILLADGLGFKDGLVAGAAAQTADGVLGTSPRSDAAGAVVLLTNGQSLPPETKRVLDAHPAAAVFAVGGNAAAAVPSATPLVGANAAETSVKVAQRFFPSPWAVGVANDAAFADGLAGGAHVPQLGGPLLLSDGNQLSPSVSAYLSSVKSVPIGFLYGGTVALAPAVADAVGAAIS